MEGLWGVFFGGALPWLEAVVVIPAGIIAGLDPVLVVLAGLTGNLLTVALAAFYGERIRQWWQRRRPQPSKSAPRRRSQRATRIFRRWGMPGLALLGPIGLGTQLSAVLGVALGVSALRTFLWIGAGTVLWSLAAAVLATSGMTLWGAS